jgi:small subunit ribosomal protein S8e
MINVIILNFITGISRDSFHKRRATGGKKAQIRKKRKYELGRPPSNTKVSSLYKIHDSRGINKIIF